MYKRASALPCGSSAAQKSRRKHTSSGTGISRPQEMRQCRRPETIREGAVNRFLSDFSNKVRKVGSRFGTSKPAWIGLLPNLPNLPHLFLPRTHTRMRTHTRTRARTCTHVYFRLGRLGRLGRTN